MFEATAQLKIRDGKLEGFKQQVDEIVRLTSERETRPLRYDWFISEDGTTCEVREAFPDADALLEHQRFIKDAKIKLLHEFTSGHSMTVYGEPSPALMQTFAGMGVEFTQFEYFQGLDVPAAVPA